MIRLLIIENSREHYDEERSAIVANPDAQVRCTGCGELTPKESAATPGRFEILCTACAQTF